MGKTVSAMLVRQREDFARCDWISLRGRIRTEAREHLLRQILARLDAASDTVVAFEEIARDYADHLSSGLLILDDVPDLNSDSLLAEQTATLAATIEAGGGRLMLTSHSRLPEQMRGVLHSLPAEWRIPPMEVDDISMLVEAAQLPSLFQQRAVATAIRAATSGHPALVAAVIRKVQSAPDLDGLRFASLLTGEPLRVSETITLTVAACTAP
jgi:hypothetical protein